MKLPFVENKYREHSRSYIAGFVLTLYFILSSLYYPNLAQAFDITSTYTVTDDQAVSGDLMSNVPGQGLVRSSTAYDLHLFGVLENEPVAVFRPTDSSSSAKPIVTAGESPVNVTDFNGTIEPGDYITTSPIAGKGMKSTTPGYVLGTATSTVTPGNKVAFRGKDYTSGQVSVAVRIEYNEPPAHSGAGFVSALLGAFTNNLQNPDKFTNVVKYIIAGLIGVTAFVFGFFAFSRAISKGIEAIGRNPLAKKSIQISIIVQVVLTVIVSLSAITLSFLILKG